MLRVLWCFYLLWETRLTQEKNSGTFLCWNNMVDFDTRNNLRLVFSKVYLIQLLYFKVTGQKLHKKTVRKKIWKGEKIHLLIRDYFFISLYLSNNLNVLKSIILFEKIFILRLWFWRCCLALPPLHLNFICHLALCAQGATGAGNDVSQIGPLKIRITLLLDCFIEIFLLPRYYTCSWLLI